jgi:hypothetical protein
MIFNRNLSDNREIQKFNLKLHYKFLKRGTLVMIILIAIIIIFSSSSSSSSSTSSSSSSMFELVLIEWLTIRLQ